MAAYGKIGEFAPVSEERNNYIEWVDQFFTVDDNITETAKKRAILLNPYRAKAYQFLRGLSNKDLISKTYT